MTMPNDKQLAGANTGVDLILGGHDHVFKSVKVDSHIVSLVLILLLC